MLLLYSRILDYYSGDANKIMAAIGHLDEFQVGKDDFDCYMDQMEQYLIVNAIAEEKQIAVFLTAIGGSVYKLLKHLVLPDTPKDKSLNELWSMLHSHEIFNNSRAF